MSKQQSTITPEKFVSDVRALAMEAVQTDRRQYRKLLCSSGMSSQNAAGDFIDVAQRVRPNMHYVKMTERRGGSPVERAVPIVNADGTTIDWEAVNEDLAEIATFRKLTAEIEAAMAQKAAIEAEASGKRDAALPGKTAEDLASDVGLRIAEIGAMQDAWHAVSAAERRARQAIGKMRAAEWAWLFADFAVPEPKPCTCAAISRPVSRQQPPQAAYVGMAVA